VRPNLKCLILYGDSFNGALILDIMVEKFVSGFVIGDKGFLGAMSDLFKWIIF